MVENYNLDDLENLESAIYELDTFLTKEEGKREKLREQVKENKDDLKSIEKDIDILEKVIILFQKTSEFARSQAKIQIESIVTNCLQFIFESDIKFSIEIQELRNKASAEFYVLDKIDNLEIKTKPEISRGGGVVDIVSLALRIAFLQISKPKIQGPLVLDEPAKHVSDDYIYNVGDFLKQSSELFNRQIIMITHNRHLAALADNAYAVELIKSISTVTKTQL